MDPLPGIQAVVYEQAVLFPGTTTLFNVVEGSKRLPSSQPGSVPTIPLHVHFVRGFAPGDPTYFVVQEVSNFDVYRTARLVRPDGALRNLGNRILLHE
jgi:hypothetical protein